MLRSILAFIAGYITMGIVVMAGFIIGPFALGIDHVFNPGTYEASTLWQWLGFAIGLVGAIIGGAVCRLISRGPRAPIVLACIAIIIAVGSAVRQKPLSAPPPPRPAEQSMEDLMKNTAEYAREPLFTRVTNPIAAGVGILLGSAIAARARRKTTN